MKNLTKSFILLFIIECFSIQLFSQKTLTISEIVSNPKANFYEIQKELNADSKLLEDAEDWEKKRYYRWEWFWRTRVDKKGQFSAYAYELNKYYKQTKTGEKSEINWLSMGPDLGTLPPDYPYTGRVESIWVHPDNHYTIYVGTDNAGLWKTLDGGVNWELATPGLPYGIHDIEVDMANGIMYIATGAYANGLLSHGLYGVGIFKSDDWGDTWTDLMPDWKPEEKLYLNKIKIDPNNPDILYTVSIYKIFKSTNGGEDWDEVLTIDNTASFREIVFMPGSSDVLFASGKKVLYRTEDGGNNWDDITSAILYHIPDTTENNMLMRIGIDCYDDKVFVLLFYKDRDLPGGVPDEYNFLLGSNDLGDSWTVIYEPNHNPDDAHLWARDYILLIKMSPDGNFFGGGRRMWISEDNTLTDIRERHYGLHADIRDICFPDVNNPNLVYVVTDGGVNMSTNKGQNWQHITGNLSVTECYMVSLYEPDPDYMLIGTHDNGTYRHRFYDRWNHIYGGDGGTSLISYDNKFVEFYSINQRLYCNGTVIEDDMNVYDAPFLQHPDNPDTVYLGKWNIWVSYNSGDSFEPYHTGGQGRVTSMAISKSNPDVFYFSKHFIDYENPNNPQKIFLFRKDGSSWPDITDNIELVAPNAVSEAASITEIKIHPEDTDIAWLTFGNFAEGDHVIQTINGGNTWHNISYNLPNLPVNTVEIDEENDILYVGTDAGIYFKNTASHPGGDNSWERYGDFPYTIVSDIKLNRNTGELVVATYGRGVWKVEEECDVSQPLVINEYQEWKIDITICSDLIVKANLEIYSNTLFIPSGKSITIDGGRIVLRNGSTIKDTDGSDWEGTIHVKNGGQLFLLPGSEITIGGNGNIVVENDGSFLRYYSNSFIELINDNNYLEIKGKLDIKTLNNVDAVFQIQGDGYLKLSGTITADNGSSLILEGNSIDHKILEIGNSWISLPSGIAKLSISNGKVVMNGDNARLGTTNRYTEVILDNVLVTSHTGSRTNQRGIYLFHTLNATITNCIFENGSYGIYSERYDRDPYLYVEHCTIDNNLYGLVNYGGGINIRDCDFINNDYGFYARHMDATSSVKNSSFTGGDCGIRFQGYSTGALQFVYSSAQNNQYGLFLDGPFMSHIICSNINNNEYGIYLTDNTSIDLQIEDGKTDLSMNKYSIYAANGDYFYLLGGLNNLNADRSYPGALDMYGRYMGMHGRIACDANLWNDRGLPPKMGTDYLLEGGFEDPFGNPEILELTDFEPLRQFTPCSKIKSETDSIDIGDDSFDPTGENLDVRYIKTKHFNNVKLNTAVAYVYALINQEDPNDILTAKLLSEILLHPYKNINNKELWYVHFAYNLFKENLGKINFDDHPSVYKTVLRIQKKLYQEVIDEDVMNKQYLKTLFRIGKAHFHHKAGMSDKAIEILNKTLGQTEDDELQQIIQKQICLITAEMTENETMMEPAELEAFLESCFVVPEENKSNSGDIVNDTQLNIQEEDVNWFENVSLQVYPNPVTGQSQIIVYADEQFKNELKVYDISGKIVSDYKLTKGDNLINITNNDFKPGIYQVILLRNGIATEKCKMVIIR